MNTNEILHLRSILKNKEVQSNQIDMLIDLICNNLNVSYKTALTLFHDLSYNTLSKSNLKQIRELVILLKTKDLDDTQCIFISFSIYQFMGYINSKDLLEDKYGIINKELLLSMFGNLKFNDIIFKKDGNKYAPIINVNLINILLGENYKIKNTPMRNYINDFNDIKIIIDKEISKINNDNNKENKIALLTQRRNKYINDINTFILNLNNINIYWNDIEEAFLKKQNKSKLNIKMNIPIINELVQNIVCNTNDKKNIRLSKINDFNKNDYALITSDVLDYAGVDTQFTTKPETAVKRAIYLSRRQNEILSKKFPNVCMDFGEYFVNVINPQDRNILSLGYKTTSCFRPNGLGDNGGSDKSLLYYCTTTEYGGALEIKDKNGRVLMFSPILRNGNVLMLHSIESSGLNNYEVEVVSDMLKKWSIKVIEESNKAEKEDGIIMVCVGDLKPENLDKSVCVSPLPYENRFVYLMIDTSFRGMYTNLTSPQYILELKEGYDISSIKYGNVDYSYDYPTHKNHYKSVSLSDEEIVLINDLIDLQQNIKWLTLSRNECLKNNEALKSSIILEKLIYYKRKYLETYKFLLSKRNNSNIDIYSEYLNAINVIDLFDKNSYDFVFKHIIYNEAYYIGVSCDNKIYGSYISGAEEDYYETYNNLLRANNKLIGNNRVLEKK